MKKLTLIALMVLIVGCDQKVLYPRNDKKEEAKKVEEKQAKPKEITLPKPDLSEYKRKKQALIEKQKTETAKKIKEEKRKLEEAKRLKAEKARKIRQYKAKKLAEYKSKVRSLENKKKLLENKYKQTKIGYSNSIQKYYKFKRDYTKSKKRYYYYVKGGIRRTKELHQGRPPKNKKGTVKYVYKYNESLKPLIAKELKKSKDLEKLKTKVYYDIKEIERQIIKYKKLVRKYGG